MFRLGSLIYHQLLHIYLSVRTMSSSSKSFKSRPFVFASTRKSTLFIFSSLFIGLFGFLFSISTIISVSCGHYRCVIAGQPKSVKVLWDTGNILVLDANKTHNAYDKKRHKVMGFVGIQTGFGSMGRRRSLRATWMPSDQQGLQRLEEATGLAFRFVIGRTSDNSKMKELRREVAEYDDFLLLDIEEEYNKLPYKTLAFFKAAYALYDSEFYVKADDDIYLRPDRLSLLLAKERHHSRTYLGCMKKGEVFTDPKNKWFEPLSYLLGREYFLNAYGPIYALSVDVVASLAALRNNSFRMFSNEDITIGAWMLTLNVNHVHNKALCEPDCTPSSIAVWDIPKCSGLCDPEKELLELHQIESCTKSATMESDDQQFS